MSIPIEPPAGGLQFDQAEFNASEPDRPACAGCQSPIADQYFEASGQLVCPLCRGRFEEMLHGGSRLGRGLKSLFLGGIAAAVGAAGYYAIMHATGWNIGLVAIVVGILIGGAVRMGSEGRGGWLYQLLALFLTYSAITAMHVPDVIASFHELARLDQQEAAAANQENAPKVQANEAGNLAAGADVPADPKPAEPPAAVAEADAEPQPPDMANVTFAQWLLAVGVILAIAYVFPILIAINAPISGLIYGFALWEAFRINKKTRVVFNGPFTLKVQGPIEPGGAADGA